MSSNRSFTCCPFCRVHQFLWPQQWVDWTSFSPTGFTCTWRPPAGQVSLSPNHLSPCLCVTHCKSCPCQCVFVLFRLELSWVLISFLRLLTVWSSCPTRVSSESDSRMLTPHSPFLTWLHTESQKLQSLRKRLHALSPWMQPYCNKARMYARLTLPYPAILC